MIPTHDLDLQSSSKERKKTISISKVLVNLKIVTRLHRTDLHGLTQFVVELDLTTIVQCSHAAVSSVVTITLSVLTPKLLWFFRYIINFFYAPYIHSKSYVSRKTKIT
jgi:hypothetical protein